MEYQVTRAEVKKLSREFRVMARQLLKTAYEDGINNLRRFIKFIESSPLIYDFILKNQVKDYDILSLINSFTYGRYEIPDTKQEEISHTYQLLKYGLDHFPEYSQFPLCVGGYRGSKIQTQVDEFNKTVVLSFVNQIEGYLNDLLIDLGDDDQSTIHIQVGNLYGGIMSQEHSITQNNDFRNAALGGGVAGRDYTGDVIHNHATQQNLAEAAVEIQQLLQQLEQIYPTTTFPEKAVVAERAIERIENNSNLKAKVIRALKAAGKEAFKEAVDHPLINVLMAAIEGWQEKT